MMIIKIVKVLAARNAISHCYVISRLKRTHFRKSSLDQEWREERGLPENPNRFGPLTNLPDYTFLDGRPTPLGMRQRERVAYQQEIAKKIVTLSGEVDFAVERYDRLSQARKEERKAIIESKLKPKGNTKL